MIPTKPILENRKCPRCGDEWVRTNHKSHPLRLDQCPRCGYVWWAESPDKSKTQPVHTELITLQRAEQMVREAVREERESAYPLVLAGYLHGQMADHPVSAQFREQCQAWLDAREEEA